MLNDKSQREAFEAWARTKGHPYYWVAAKYGPTSGLPDSVDCFLEPAWSAWQAAQQPAGPAADQRAVMQQALDALEWNVGTTKMQRLTDKAVTALRQALAAPVLPQAAPARLPLDGGVSVDERRPRIDRDTVYLVVNEKGYMVTFNALDLAHWMPLPASPIHPAA